MALKLGRGSGDTHCDIMATTPIDTTARTPSSDQIIAGLRRRTLLLPALSVVVSLSLLALLLTSLPGLAAYAVVFGVALVSVVFFARGVSQTTHELRTSLEATTERNVLLSDRERTNREVADEAIQSLYGAALRLDSCLDRLQDQAGIREDVDAAAESLTEVIGQIRRYVLELQPLPAESTTTHPIPHERLYELIEVGTGHE
jgi:signal transduction histidine kinase